MRNLILISSLLLAASCLAPEGPPPNPFEGRVEPTDTLIAPVEELDPNSIEGIHARIFRPTCANSGCHDGTFEPDFRTIESSYNTLVWQPIIKNNPQGSYDYRVVPGELNASVLWQRLKIDIDGQSGIMPLVVDPDSDWNEEKDNYLANIQNWISGGAKDIFGNPPLNGDLQPSLRGMVAFPTGSTGNPLSRNGGNGAIKVPSGTNSIDLWFSLTDDQAQPQNLLHNKASLSPDANGFAGTGDRSLQVVNPITKKGLLGDNVAYHHKLTVNLGSYGSGTQVYVRVYVKDSPSAEITEIPADGSASYTKTYFSFLRK